MRISDWSSDVCSSDLLRFAPGLVGGHCIGVDPYYLSYKAQQLGMLPRVVLEGRSINDGMSNYLADEVHSRLGKAGRVLMLGLTDRKSVVSGKSVSVRVALGGRSFIKNKIKLRHQNHSCILITNSHM